MCIEKAMNVISRNVLIEETFQA